MLTFQAKKAENVKPVEEFDDESEEEVSQVESSGNEDGEMDGDASSSEEENIAQGSFSRNVFIPQKFQKMGIKKEMQIRYFWDFLMAELSRNL